MAGDPHGTVRYSDVELAEFKELIELKLAQANKEVEKLEEQKLDHSESLHDNGYDIDENHGYADVEFLTNLINRQKKHIQDLEFALIRIKNKTYGICTVTGQLIDKKRLLAVPTTSKSLDAKIASQQQSMARVKLSSDEEDDDEDSDTKKVKAPAAPKIITKIHRKFTPQKKEVDRSFLDEDDDDTDDLDDFDPDEIISNTSSEDFAEEEDDDFDL